MPFISPRSIVLSLLLSLLSIGIGSAQVYTPKEVPNVQVQDARHYISDPTGQLSPHMTDSLNAQIARLRTFQGVEIAVVILPQIAGDDPERFAEELFSLWGIGQAKEDNGLLILYVYDPKARFIRFETGYGLEGTLPDAVTHKLTRQEMVPRILEGDTDGAFAAALNAVETHLASGYERRYATTSKEKGARIWSDFAVPLSIYVLFSLIVAFTFALGPGQAVKSGPTALHQYAIMKEGERPNAIGCLIILFPLLALVIPIQRYVLNRAVNKRNSHCPQCGNSEHYHILQGDATHPHLTPQLALESQLGSSRSYVALCDSCGYKEVATKHPSLSSIKTCPKCGTRAVVKEQREWINSSRYVDIYRCRYCQHTERKLRRIHTPPYTPGGGGFGGGFGGGGGSFGGGFGGGRSGGGGSTVRF